MLEHQKAPKVAAFVLYSVKQGGKAVLAVGIIFMDHQYGDILQTTQNSIGINILDLNTLVNGTSNNGQGAGLPSTQTFLDAIDILNGSAVMTDLEVSPRTEGTIPR